MTGDPRNAPGTDRSASDDHLTTADLAHGAEQASEQRAAPTPVPPAPVEREREIPPQRERSAAQTDQSAQPGSSVPGSSVPDSGAPARDTAPGTTEPASAPLFSPDEATEFRTRWTNIQAAFVDEPRRAVEHADELVANTMKRLAEIFAHERTQLEEQWARGGDVSTEDLRQALRRYRAFFDRLLSV